MIHEDDNFGEDSDHKQETKLRFKFAWDRSECNDSDC